MSNIIDSIQVSGVTYAIQGGSGNPTVELTQAEYNALVESGAVQTNTYYIITDAQPADISQYWTSAQTQSAITSATSGKVDTTAITSSVTSASTDAQIPTAKAVYDAVGSGGGGKAVSGGTNISITTGETADTINCTLPINVSQNSPTSLKLSDNNTYINFANYSVTEGYGGGIDDSSHYSHKEGYNSKIENYCSGSHVEGYYCEIKWNSKYSHAEGYYTKTANESEHASGRYNVSNKTSTTFGNSGNTLFSVGNGTADNARHNAFEIRQNGDIYYFDGTNDVKLQDKFSSLDTTIGNINTILESI